MLSRMSCLSRQVKNRSRDSQHLARSDRSGAVVFGGEGAEEKPRYERRPIVVDLVGWGVSGGLEDF